MSKQTEALKLALEQTLEMLTDNREYIEANERAEYLAMYDKAIAGAGKALAEQPAQRTWVGLTDEEITHIADSEWEEAFVRMIESKLKEKNHD